MDGLNDREPIHQLFKQLDEDLRRDSTGPNIPRLIQEYTSKYEDWKEYVHFNDIKYARNLVYANDMLEMIIICWKSGQASPIHNHEV